MLAVEFLGRCGGRERDWRTEAGVGSEDCRNLSTHAHRPLLFGILCCMKWVVVAILILALAVLYLFYKTIRLEESIKPLIRTTDILNRSVQRISEVDANGREHRAC